MINGYKKVLFPSIAVLIIGLTSFVFYRTQDFYMLFARGQRYIRSGNYRQAQDVFLKALALAPQDIRTVQYIFLTDEKLRTHQGSRKAYTIIENAGKEHPAFSLYVADHFYSEAYYEKAERIYKKLITSGQRREIENKLAEVLLWQKKYDEAIVLLDDLVQKDPGDKKTRLLLANASFWAGHFHQAVELYRSFLGTDMQTDEVVFNLAEALRFLGRDEEAVQIYDSFLQNK